MRGLERLLDHLGIEERHFRFPHDSIDAVIIEKAAMTYVFGRGAFQAIITAD